MGSREIESIKSLTRCELPKRRTSMYLSIEFDVGMLETFQGYYECQDLFTNGP